MLRGNKIETRPVEWLCPSKLGQRFPVGMIALIAGRPGLGKSSLTAYLTAQVTREGYAVIHSAHEDALREILVPRLIAAGADMKRVFLPELPIVIPDELESLERTVKQVKARLIVMDTAAQHLRPSIFSDQEVRKALTPLQKMLERTGCSAVLVSHTKKGRFADPLEAIGGSSGGLVGAARVVYIFGADPTDPDARVLAPAKSNVGPTDLSTEYQCKVVDFRLNRERGGPLTHKIVRLEPVTHHSKVSAAAVTAVPFAGARRNGVDAATDPTRLALAEEWLTGLLRHGPVKATDVEAEAAKVKLTMATVRRAQASIGVAKTRVGGSKGYWAWDLPAGHPLKAARPAPPAAGKPDGNGKQKVKSVDAQFAQIVQGLGTP